MDVHEAIKIVGSELGEPSKMPGFSIGLPAKDCITGSKLRDVEGSVCHKCYAFRGNYTFPHVRDALERRLIGIEHPQWVEAMVTLIRKQRMHKNDDNSFFRFHDSGDLQSIQHLRNICAICRRCPTVRFWLPTREYGILQGFVAQRRRFPKNLVVRLSAHMIGGPLPLKLAEKLKVNVSGVHFKGAPLPKGITECEAYTRGNECGSCRQCWDPKFEISYPKH